MTEIILFILAGDLIGLWPTLALVALTTLLGLMVLRSQGAVTAQQLRAAQAGLAAPAGPLAGTALRFTAGVMLLLPGFLSDAIGLLLLLPPVRGWLIGKMGSKLAGGFPGGAGFSAGFGNRGGFAAGFGGPAAQPARDDIVDAEVTEITPGARPLSGPQGPSGWQKPPSEG